MFFQLGTGLAEISQKDYQLHGSCNLLRYAVHIVFVNYSLCVTPDMCFACPDRLAYGGTQVAMG